MLRYTQPQQRRRRKRGRLDRGKPFRASFVYRIGPNVRRELLREPWVFPVFSMQFAAIRVQAFIRGSLVRKQPIEVHAQRAWRAKYGGAFEQEDDDASQKTRGPRPQMEKYLAALRSWESVSQRHSMRYRQRGPPPWAHGGFSEWCAVRIQAWWRMLRPFHRRTLRRFTMYHLAALEIQTVWIQLMEYYAAAGTGFRRSSEARGARDGKQSDEMDARDAAADGKHAEAGGVFQEAFGNSQRGPEDDGQGMGAGGHAAQTAFWEDREPGISEEERHLHRCARRIVGAWRSFVNRKVYRYFRDLVQFRLSGDPRDLLKTIAPMECDLLDPAAGVHVRFRLGGVTFPPAVYYKVFTHRPLCDIGAFAPRDYVQDRFLLDPWQRHTNPRAIAQERDIVQSRRGRIRVGTKYFDTHVITGAEGTKRWYRRKENNGWRCITAATLEEALEDPVTQATNAKATKFHYSRHRRMQDVELMKKRKRREWMMKLYSSGPSATATTTATVTASKNRMGGHTDSGRQPYMLTDGGAGSGSYGGSKLASADEGGKGADDDGADLLQWSQALDFDDYWVNWVSMGTSAPSSNINRYEDPSMGTGTQELLLQEQTTTTRTLMTDDG